MDNYEKFILENNELEYLNRTKECGTEVYVWLFERRPHGVFLRHYTPYYHQQTCQYLCSGPNGNIKITPNIIFGSSVPTPNLKTVELQCDKTSQSSR